MGKVVPSDPPSQEELVEILGWMQGSTDAIFFEQMFRDSVAKLKDPNGLDADAVESIVNTFLNFYVAKQHPSSAQIKGRAAPKPSVNAMIEALHRAAQVQSTEKVHHASTNELST